ncbi:MAG: alpha/beta fold hydrolase [Betaproteobacteria bacterium]|nr:alpha/beta fold hydrolase [Betaproteobacteria bacterium]
MPSLCVADDLDMFYAIDDYTDPWKGAETILMLHGLAESHEAWFAWVPALARHFRIVRPDMRGFGKTTAMPVDYPWNLDTVVDDFVSLMDALATDRFHVIAAKIGGTVARRLAARFPGRVRTLTVAGTPPPYRDTVAARAEAWSKEIRVDGIESWARRTMLGRLGDKFPAEGVAWWAELMARTAPSSVLGSILPIPSTDIRGDLAKISCPTLVITTPGSGLGSVEETRSWQSKIPDSELLVCEGNSYHVAASHADECAAATLRFLRRHPGQGGIRSFAS